MSKSCMTCPSYMSKNERVHQVSRFGKSLESPTCARFGKVLGTPRSTLEQNTKIAQSVGQGCAAHGDARPKSATTIDLTVMLPLPKFREVPHTRDVVTSCASCKNFVPEPEVVGQLGWPAAMCAARGELILATELNTKAKGCEYNQYKVSNNGSNYETPDLREMRLMPELSSLTFIGKLDPARAYKEARKNFIDPTEYPTDLPVSEDSAAEGIRAWRKLVDPEGSGNEVYLPIFNMDFFAESEQVKVPRSGDDEHPEEYVDHQGLVYKAAVLWTELDETPALWGVAGTGKTEFYRHMAWLMCLPFERVSVTGSTELDDLAGKMHFRDNQTVFEYGRIPKAWARPCVLCIDEPNVGPPDVWQFIRPLTDSSKQLVLDMNNGERIARNSHAYLGMAMNPAWDPRNVGTAQISDADGSRLMHIYVTLPGEDLEREIIRNRCKLDGYEISTETLGAMMRIAKDLRGLSDGGTIPVTWGIRPQIKVARATRFFNMTTAYNLAAADYLDPDAKETILEVVKSHDSSVF